jgi:hypothetical protein
MNGAISLKEIRELFERLGASEQFYEQEPLLLWPQVAGPQMSKLTQPLRVRQGVLYIEAANHTVAQQLSLLKEVYLKKLKALLSEPRIHDLRFRVGSSFPGARSSQHDPHEGEQLNLLEREQISHWLDELDDPKLKEIFESWIKVSIHRDRERARRGEKRCEICGIHHDGDGEICYYCELEGRVLRS